VSALPSNRVFVEVVMRRAILTVVGALGLAACTTSQNGFDSGVSGDAGDVRRTQGDASQNYDDVMSITDGSQWMLTPDSACARQVADTQRAPMNLLFVLDRSGSMADNGKWTALVDAMHHLVDTLSRTAPETRVGITFFPAGSNPDTEDGYRMPAVPVQPLSSNRAVVDGVLNATSPDGNTPMACAIVGSEGDMGYLPGLDVNGSRNVILITDGDPTEECSGHMCDPFDVFNYPACATAASMDAQIRIQATASRGFMLSPPIRTYVVATPEANAAFLSTVAINGGTRRMPGCEASNTCHYSLGSSTFEADLNAALDEIRGRAATCEFRITADTTGADPNFVNVLFTPSEGAEPELIHRDTTRMNGWDWSDDMQSVQLYGDACNQVLTNTTGGQVQVLFGCPPG
jgi:hypothetical protein